MGTFSQSVAGPVFRFSGSPARPPPPPFPPNESVLVSTQTPHFFGDFERVVPGCDVACEFRGSVAGEADAIWHHAPTSCFAFPQRAFPTQLAVVMSMESAANAVCLLNKAYMASFDIEMTYRITSDIPITYLRVDHLKAFANADPVPFEQKKNAVVYIQSNCGAQSGRDAILERLMALGVAVEARGVCLNNAQMVPREESKTDAMRDYLFCATMENSLVVDYVSEKLWDGMSSGCLPIYYGAPNIQEQLPSENSIVDYLALGATPEALAAELQRLAGDKAAYEAKMKWRHVPAAELGEGYQMLVRETHAEHSQCRLCKLIVVMRRDQPARLAAAKVRAIADATREASAEAEAGKEALEAQRQAADKDKVEGKGKPTEVAEEEEEESEEADEQKMNMWQIEEEEEKPSPRIDLPLPRRRQR